ncbi:MAG: penicillin-binding protein [Acidobacteriota bacterium]|nr:penicillin-binding protein [Acidobacteriota bacterium]
MRLFRALACGLTCIIFGWGATAHAAIDSPQTIHHAKTASHRLSKTSHKRSHHTVARRGTRRSATRKSGSKTVAHSRRGMSSHSARLRRTSLHTRRHRYYERFTMSSYTHSDIFADDVTAGEDPVVRQAAIDALGNMNGTAVVINPANGRILAMVNQKLALSPGAEPCSTIKLSVALAALKEGIVTKDTMVKLAGFRMNMTQALAKSNNLYFEELGRELGFERVHKYATEFGLGELAGWHIDGEQLGTYPDEAIPASQGGVGRMCSFGQGVNMTPLQLGALVAAMANGGTLYYLQHPTTPEEVASFEPRVKRQLDIAEYVPEMLPGMEGAVEFGTARRLHANFDEFPVFGKTGTCSNDGTRFGWFVSYSQTPIGNLVTVFFLEGGRPTFGPRAAELTGEFYKNLWDHNYFAGRETQQAQAAVTETEATR